LPFFAQLMQFLCARGISCPEPIAMRSGEFVGEIKNKPTLIVSFLQGSGVQHIEVMHLRALGAEMARMHKAGEGFTTSRANGLSLKGWQSDVNTIGNRADTIMPGLAQILAEELRVVTLSWPKALPAGVIHADLFPDNVFFDAQGKLTGIIDFYLACNDFFAYDLVIALNAWCFNVNHTFDITKAKELFAAYQTIRPLTQNERDALPLLARGAALNFLLLRAHHVLFSAKDVLVTHKDPMEYVKKLKFHQSVKSYKEYGL